MILKWINVEDNDVVMNIEINVVLELLENKTHDAGSDANNDNDNDDNNNYTTMSDVVVTKIKAAPKITLLHVEVKLQEVW